MPSDADDGRRRYRRLAAALLLALAGEGHAQAPPAAIKAAYLYNFALYTEWPQPGDSVGICFAGGEVFAVALGAIAGKSIRGRPISLRNVDNDNDLAECKVLYVGPVPPARRARLARALAGRPILTVADNGDGDDFRPMIQLVPDGPRIAFDIDLGAIRAAGLNLSSQVLQLARTVR